VLLCSALPVSSHVKQRRASVRWRISAIHANYDVKGKMVYDISAAVVRIALSAGGGEPERAGESERARSEGGGVINNS